MQGWWLRLNSLLVNNNNSIFVKVIKYLFEHRPLSKNSKIKPYYLLKSLSFVQEAIRWCISLLFWKTVDRLIQVCSNKQMLPFHPTHTNQSTLEEECSSVMSSHPGPHPRVLTVGFPCLNLVVSLHYLFHCRRAWYLLTIALPYPTYHSFH